MKNSFRLNSVSIEEKHFLTKEILLTNNSVRNSDNYYTLIVGNNGTGKSRLLGTIARHFLDLSLDGKGRNMFGDGFIYENTPSKVIAVTSSISNRFPNDRTFISSNFRRRISGNSNYHYLGSRNNANNFSNKTLLTRAISIMFDNISNTEVLNKYRHLFDYLQYQPIIKITHRLGSLIRKSESAPITVSDLDNYIREKSNGTTFRSSYFKTFENSRKDYLPELCSLINKIAKLNGKEYSLLINFSQSNINRMDEENSDYSEATREFFLLSILERIDLVRRADVIAYKADNSEFDFHEASSGEVSILSTLISLIPLLSDGCLVLIDEPEISLHPSWQYRYVDLLLKIFENFTGCHIIIASHSHFLVSDLPIHSSTVITLINDKGVIKSSMIQESTYGWSVEDILFNVFKLPTVRNYYLYQLVTEALEMLANFERPENNFKEIQEKISFYEPYIKESDPLKEVVKSITEIQL